MSTAQDGDIHEQTTVGGLPADDGLVRAPASASTRDARPQRLEPSIGSGDVLGRYRIVERLGEGGMGVVYRAFDPQLKRDVALKIMRSTGGDDSLGHATEATLREARALAQLSHPNVVEIFDVGTFGGQVFMAMELLHGITLTKWLRGSTSKDREGRRKSRPWREVVDVLVKAGQGLAAAHARGVVHRDFKPDNVDEALAAVPDPQRCLRDESRDDGWEDLRQSEHGSRFARASMLAKVGRYADSLAIIDELKERVAGAEQWRYRLILDTEAGFLLDQLGKYDEAVARLQPAALEARSRREDMLAAWAAVRLMRTLGVRLHRVDEAMQWMRFIESSLQGAEPGKDLDSLRETLHFNHAGILFAQGELAPAIDAYESGLALCESGRTRDSCGYLTMSISQVLDAMGKHQEAREHYERVIADYEEGLGAWHPKLATPIDNLGIVLFGLGDYEGAAHKHARSLAIREAAFGPDNPEVGLSLTNLGLAELELERLADSRVHQERAVENWRKSLGEEHPYVAAALTNLALVRSLEGASPDELITLHRQALQIREAALGPDNPEVGTSLANLGNALTDKGDYDDARRQLDRARALWVKAYGEGSERVASIDIDLGDLAKEQEAWDDAAMFFEQARKSYEEKLGAEHGRAVWVRYKLGNVELQRGELVRAKELLERAQRELEATPTEIYRRALATFGLARLRAAEGEREQARTLAREAKARTKELEATDSRGPELREDVDAWLARGMRDGD